ncbi:universal stress protein [Hydrogenophaga sp. ZJX-1]|uniref:universal stress protein n=1 Tax=Hydrogenophaga sp. ZJX-1 TaxID=3404778 RepID=UPI003B280D58
MHFDSILAVSDFTVLSAHALERTALLARQHQTPLRLVHFADSPKTYLTAPSRAWVSVRASWPGAMG